MKGILFLGALILLIFMPSITHSQDLTESEIVQSGERVVKVLEDKFSAFIMVRQAITFYVTKYKKEGPAIYDLERTDSILAPYVLTIKLELRSWTNFFSPNANAQHPFYKGNFGFKTPEDALANIKENDFLSQSETHRMMIVNTTNEDVREALLERERSRPDSEKDKPVEAQFYYALQNKNWILKRTDGFYFPIIDENMEEQKKSKYRDIIILPVY